MQGLDECSVDAVVCDPPYGLEFMGKEWDRLGAETEAASDTPAFRSGHGGLGSPSPNGAVPFGGGGQRVRYGSSAASMQDWHQAWATEALRILKPGGHLLAAGGTRTFHRLVCAIEDAGFEIRDCIAHMYGSGFPKSLNLDGDWQGFGTALKPGFEPWTLARKPLVGTVAQNVLEHGTGALNIDGTRIQGADDTTTRHSSSSSSYLTGEIGAVQPKQEPYTTGSTLGRWPANVTLSHLDECEAVGERKVKAHWSQPTRGENDGAISYGQGGKGEPVGYADPDGTETVTAWNCAEGCPVAELDRQSGNVKGAVSNSRGHTGTFDFGTHEIQDSYADTGGASRFFYQAKASRAEREAGLGGSGEGAPRNAHPT